MKRFLPYILIGGVIISALFFFNVKIGYAWCASLGGCIKEGAAWVGYIILTIVSQLVSIAGYFLDASVSYSISNAGVGALRVVETGWALSRDVANLFFIFILLYIAIATILQLSSYGMKSLLARLIIIALLVNFSLVICKVVIDASNILALEFYNKMQPQGHSLSELLVSGLNPQTLFGISTPEGEIKLGNNQSATLMQIILITFLGSGMFLVIAFVLLAAAVLFVIRIAILWILMILAPLAFLFMVLPKTKQYADQWWETLFKQSFFAPVYLFLLYMVITIITKGSILTDLQANNQSFGTAFGSPNDANIRLVLNFSILIILIISSLIIAQKMGAYGASTAVGWGKAAGKWGRGVAGRATRRATIARPARAIAESKFAQRFAAVSPRLGGAMLRTMQTGAKVGGLDKVTEAKVNTGMSLPPKLRPEYIRNADRRTQEEMFRKMSARERVEARDIGGAGFASTHTSLMNTLSAEEREKTEKLGKEVERKNIVNNLATSVNFANDIKLIKPEEIADLDKSIATDPAKIRAILATISDAHLKKIEDRGDELTDAVIDALYALDSTGAKNAVNIAAELRNPGIGNNKLARVIETGPVRARLGLT